MRWVDSIVAACKGQVPRFSVFRSEVHNNSEPNPDKPEPKNIHFVLFQFRVFVMKKFFRIEGNQL